MKTPEQATNYTDDMEKEDTDTPPLKQELLTENIGQVIAADDEDTNCGVGSCKPKSLQRFANMPSYVGFYSVAALLSSTLLSYVNSQVTTLERQFGLSSAETGIIMASNDIGYLVVLSFIGQYATRAHIPRWISASVMLFGISGLICCLPHFLFGAEMSSAQADDHLNITSKSRDLSIQLCLLANDSVVDNCQAFLETNEPEPSQQPRANAKAAVTLIIIGMVLQGMAKAPRHPFIITYIDGNVEKVKTGYYLGIIISLAIFGPVFAFGLGSYFSRIYVTLEETDLYPRHPRWIGAWWLGYLVFGVAAIIVSLPIFFFPRRLKGAPRTEQSQKTQPVKIEKERSVVSQIIYEAKEYIGVMASILTNPVYVLIVMANVLHLFSVGGAHAFMSKYYENQFSLPVWKANLLMGGLSMPAASFGTFVGGWLTKKLKMSPLLALKMVTFGLFITVGLSALGFVFGCPQPTVLRGPDSTTTEMTSNQNNSSDCHCQVNDYFPICGSDNKNYYSPCRAGCVLSNGPLYKNCSYIPDGGQASAGLCEFDCPFLYPYAVSGAVSAFMSTMLIMPKIIVKIRCVTEKEKATSVAFSSLMTSIFAWLLGPIVYGRVIDSSCLLWNSSCGERGSCAQYDIADFRVKIHSFYVVSRGLGTLTLFLALIVAIKTKKFEKITNEYTLSPRPLE